MVLLRLATALAVLSLAPAAVAQEPAPEADEKSEEAAPAPAPAAEPEPAPTVTTDVEPSGYSMAGESISMMDSPKSRTEDWLVRPPGTYELGASLAFVTSEPSLRGRELKFTDLVFLRPSGRWTPTRGLEVFAGLDLLVKQPSFTDEIALQAATIGSRVSLAKRYALGAQVSGGALVDGVGNFGSGAVILFHKRRSDEILYFETAIGGSATALRFDEGHDDTFWVAEGLVRGEALIRAPNGVAGCWLGFDFSVPFAHAPGADDPDPKSGTYLDPQVRVDVHLGGVLAIVPHLDLFAQISVIDRGDLSDPTTTLPVIDGGFDQRQFVFGIIRRFADQENERQGSFAY